MSYKQKLTGRTRHRVVRRFIGEPYLVLQVEVHETGYGIDEHGVTPDVDYKFWRDAVVEDLTEKEVLL